MKVFLSIPLLVLYTCIFSMVQSTNSDLSHSSELLPLLAAPPTSTPEFASCQAYFTKVITILNTTKNLHELPTSFQQTMELSGRYLNDMGEVDTCRETAGMSFVRITIKLPPPIPLTVYQGFCLVSECNASVLDSNKLVAFYDIQLIVRSLLSVIISQPLPNNVISSASNFNQSSFSFQPFEEYTQSQDDPAFIIAVSAILLCVLVTLASPILKAAFFSPKKQVSQHTLKSSENTSTTTTTTSNESIITARQPEAVEAVTEPPASKERKQRRGPPMYVKVLQCWNISDNWKKIFIIKSNNDDLLVFNGIRSLCFMQVILGHEFYLHINYMNNPLDIMIEQNKPFVLFAISCLYSVDVFFWLGGFFLAYVVADEKTARAFSLKKPVKVLSGFVFATINRVFRIWPCYFIVLMFFWKIVPYMSGSPTWDLLFNASDNCNTRWWQNLLFIDNMFGGQYEKCFGWGWYLSNDFQMFLYGMILLIIYANNKFVGKLAILLSLAATQAVSIVLAYQWNFKIPMNAVNLGVPHYYDGYYTKPWTRSPPYFIGIFLGILYKEYQAEKVAGKAISSRKSLFSSVERVLAETNWKWMCYGFGTVLYTGIVFGPNYLQVNGLDAWPNTFQNFWFGTCRTFYVIAVSCFVIPGMLGSKDFIVRFYANKMFAFLQKLSFCGYLTHYIIILYTIWQTRDSVYYNVENLLELFVTEVFLTLLASMVVTMIIEMPIANLSFLLLGGRKPSNNKSNTAQAIKQDNNDNKNKEKELNNNEIKISIKSSVLSTNEADSLNTSLIEQKQPTAIN